MINKQLIHLLKSGRCIALVGSGASDELGYHSWRKLARTDVNATLAVYDDNKDAIAESQLRGGDRNEDVLDRVERYIRIPSSGGKDSRCNHEHTE
jgi:hypothetical protein